MNAIRKCAVLAGVLLCAAFSLSETLAAEPQTSRDLPSLKSLSKPSRSLSKARQELLSSLYDQLQAAKTEEAAELIVSGIEKLWSQSGSDTADLLMQRAGIAVKSQNYKLATQLLTSLTRIEPRFAEGWNQLATIYFMQENYADAMRQLQRVLALDPRHFKAIEGLGIILRETGNKKAALEVTRRALAVNPHLKSAKQAAEELEREIEGQGI